ncbi:putative interferon-induced GTP-binding protein Mx1 [Colletotrichum tofieldiae]|nr:putative interferon-induced GTP-binding protein Mx1 [Colletotrichum tofieldiae]
MSHIEEVFESSRGSGLETSEKRVHLVLSHVSNAIALVHEYIYQLLTELCPEKQMRDNLWDTLLLDKLMDSYQRAMRHSSFLLNIERGGTPNTFNHTLRTWRMRSLMSRMQARPESDGCWRASLAAQESA